MLEGGSLRLVPVRLDQDLEFSDRLQEYWRDLGASPAAAWHARYLARLAEEEGRTRHTFWGQEGAAHVGFVMLRLDADWMFPQRQIGYIAEFTVFSPWRRRGYGRRLFELARNWLAERGCEQVELDVLPANRAGLAFWRDIGFSVAYHHMRRP